MAEILERRAFVGRAHELARLNRRLAAIGGSTAPAGATGPTDSTDSTGSTVIVAGEAGIGKTRLVARFLEDAAAAGAMVLQGSCLAVTANEIPYGPFIEILRRLVRTTPPERLPAVLGPARGELARLLPELAPRVVDLPPASGLDPMAQVRLFEPVVGLLGRLARAGVLVLVIEDVQWADRSTRDLVGYLVRALREERALVILTARTEGIRSDPAATAFLSQLERGQGVERIDLGPLGRADVAAQMAALLQQAPDGALVDRILERADGNPFFVEELVLATPGHPGGALPAVLRDVLAARVGGLSPATRDVLRVAALSGRRIDDDLLATALGIAPRVLAVALREAFDSGILVRVDTPSGPTSAFRHELLREAVDEEVFPAERVALHLAFAEALEGRHSGGRPVPPAELAYHWDRAGRPDRALAPLIEACLDAERVYAFGDALRLWDQARVACERAPSAATGLALDLAGILERGAEAAGLAGEYGHAVELVRAALEVVDQAVDPSRAAHLLGRLRWFLWESGDRVGATRALDASLRLIPRDPPTVALARALGQLAGLELRSQAYEAARAHAEEAMVVARAAGAPAEMALAMGVLGWAEAVFGDVDGGITRLREAASMAERLGSVEGIALAAGSLVSLLDRVGRPAEAIAAALDGYALVERLGVARSQGGLLLGFAARAQITLGRLDEAERSTHTGLALHPGGPAEVCLLVNSGRVHTYRGAFEEAGALLRRAREIDDGLGKTEFRVALLAAQVELAAWSGRPRDGRDAVSEALAIDPHAGPPEPDLAWVAVFGLRAEADLAEAARAAHDDAGLARSVAIGGQIIAAVSQAAETAGAYLPGEGARLRGLRALIAAEGSRIAGRDRAQDWSSVAAIYGSLGRTLPAGYAEFRSAAAALRDRGPREEAGRALASAHATATRLGALPLQTMVEDLARHARIEISGSRSSTASPGSDHRLGDAEPVASYHLTERELEVLRLVAGGWTNQQIGDRLFITRKTASVHVSNILGKLGVDSWGAAAAIAYRLGVGADAPPPPGLA